MLLEYLQFLIDTGTDLARVEFANLDPHVLGTFKSTDSDMLLCLPLVFERLFAARALVVTRSILLWMAQSLLSKGLFTSFGVLRLVGGH